MLGLGKLHWGGMVSIFWSFGYSGWDSLSNANNSYISLETKKDKDMHLLFLSENIFSRAGTMDGDRYITKKCLHTTALTFSGKFGQGEALGATGGRRLTALSAAVPNYLLSSSALRQGVSFSPAAGGNEGYSHIYLIGSVGRHVWSSSYWLQVPVYGNINKGLLIFLNKENTFIWGFSDGWMSQTRYNHDGSIPSYVWS